MLRGFVCPKRNLGAVGGNEKIGVLQKKGEAATTTSTPSSTLSLLEQRPHRNGNHRIIISLYNAYAETYRFATYNADVVATATAN